MSPQFIRGKTPYRKRNRRHQATIATQRLLNCENTSSRKTQAKAKNKYRLKFQKQEMKQNSGDSDGDEEQTDLDPEDNKENEIGGTWVIRDDKCILLSVLTYVITMLIIIMVLMINHYSTLSNKFKFIHE